MIEVMPLPSMAGGPSQGMAANPSQKASMGTEAISSSRTYLPLISSTKPSSRLRIHQFMGTR